MFSLCQTRVARDGDDVTRSDSDGCMNESDGDELIKLDATLENKGVCFSLVLGWCT